jgi:hypothetical protein
MNMTWGMLTSFSSCGVNCSSVDKTGMRHPRSAAPAGKVRKRSCADNMEGWTQEKDNSEAGSENSEL